MTGDVTAPLWLSKGQRCGMSRTRYDARWLQLRADQFERMAYTLPVAFDQFYDAINLSGDHRAIANTRRAWLERALKGKLEVLETIAFGSIPRFTALSDHADVDVLVALHYGQHIKDKQPSTVLQLVREALAPLATTSIRRNGQAVTLTFESWPNVDVVPASRVTDPTTDAVLHYNIPDMHRGEWIATNPKEHARRVEGRASTCGRNFRRLITMMKHWNRLKNASRLQSYHVETIAIDTFTSDMGDLPWALLTFFGSARGKLDFHWSGNANVSAYLDYETRSQVHQSLTEAEALARAAWYAGYSKPDDHEEAIGLWRGVLGMKFPSYG